MGLQFLLEGRRRGESGLFIALSENRSELLHVAASHGWSLEGIELYEMESLENHQPENQYTVFHPSEVELSHTIKQVRRRIEELAPAPPGRAGGIVPAWTVTFGLLNKLPTRSPSWFCPPCRPTHF
jgi:KaiC/GvpD/RAD55 family RecA-like ATPase